MVIASVGGKDRLAHGVLRGDVRDRPEQREAAPLAVDRVLTRGECDVPAGAAAALPDPEANQLETGEGAVAEVEFGVR